MGLHAKNDREYESVRVYLSNNFELVARTEEWRVSR